ncbi:cytochrome P450 [Protofrankia symbiont of Coriaria ruscifolia]|uniref:Cytochrome P450 105A3 n=1 Tax=Candidatus Protofrankia californiensis TaxID=1839754 RepID=A0A1C3PG95_9ACTN|nr:cytochrome P450 [Protofrankia symbiont of Coriaria ruscifolia]SBW28810.1 Cytochrome P450 105A3 [Candidatus Protofrankia californiensis]
MTETDAAGGDSISAVISTAADTTRAEPPAFPLQRGCPFFPPTRYETLRETEPVARVTLPTGRHAWIITRYEDVRALLADPRVSADARHPDFPAMGVGEREAAARNRPFIRTDPPDHTRHRRMLQAEFTVRRVTNMVPTLTAYAEELVDEMHAAGPPSDLVSAYANRMSTATVLNLMGVPTDDLEFFRDVTRISGGRQSSAQEVQAALGGMFAKFDALIDRRLREPGEDLFSRLVVNHLATGAVTRQELLSTVGITIVAGRETTTSMIALGTLMLLERPDRLAELRERPEMLGEAVEELLRMLSVADSIPLRVATADLEVGGVTIRAGEGMILLLAGANHDPTVFPNPTELDFHRPDRHHLAFGFGIHQCIGQNLARTELEIALGTLIRWTPTLRLAVPFDELELRHDAATFGIEALPVAW